MVTVSLRGVNVSVYSGQNVLDALLGAGMKIPHSCRIGACQNCMLQMKHGELPADAQTGLQETLKRQGYFLACRCYPDQDLVLSDTESASCQATVMRRIQRSPSVIEIHLKPDRVLNYAAGQHVLLQACGVGKESEARTYSLASVPSVDEFLSIQVAKIAGGRVSTWVHEQLAEGDTVAMQEPRGNCFFVPANDQQSILFAGTGTGLAPLYGMLREALHSNHNGELHLFHGAADPQELYLHQELLGLELLHDRFHYYPCVRDNRNDNRLYQQSIEERLDEVIPSLSDWQVYLCGNPDFVAKMRMKVFMAGASMRSIFAENFVSNFDNQRSRISTSPL